MLPFVRMLEYGNVRPESTKVLNYFMDDGNATPLMWMHLSNGELWGTCSPTYGNMLGLPNGVTYYGSMHLAYSAVKTVWGSQYGTFLLNADNRLMFAGRLTIYDGTANTTPTWTDRTDFYSTYFNVQDIKKIVMNFNTVYILLNNGELWSHGANTNGFFGRGNTEVSYVPLLLKSTVLNCWLSTSNGLYQDISGKIYGTGNNIYRQMQTTSESTVYISWTELFAAQTAAVDYEFCALRVSSANFILYRTDGKYFCSGRNYSGSWGIGNINIDINVTMWNGQLSFKPGNLAFLYEGIMQVYWTNIITDDKGVLYFAGTLNGGGSYKEYSFTPAYHLNPGTDGNKCKISTNTRSFTVCEIGAAPSVYACGSSMTTSSGVGFTPLSTPLKETFTYIDDFNLGG